jgi:cAMP-dependent protein kinase regulator
MGGCSSKEAGADSSQKVIQNLVLSQSYTCFFMLTQNPFQKSKGPERGLPAADASQRINVREEQIKLHAKTRKAVQGRFLDVDADFQPPDYPKSKEDVKFLDEALGENFIFAELSSKERSMLIKALQKQECTEGEVIIKQGDVGDFFYICETGSVNFVADGKDVGACSTGGSFGELSLLYDSPRAATCVAGTACKLWKVDQNTFKMLLARTNMDHESSVSETLAKIDLFKGLDKAVISKFASVLSTLTFAEGEAIVQKGEQGDVFYIINEGQVRVHDIGLGDASYADQVLKHGDWFGERALMTGEPRAANVTAMTETQAFAVDRKTFETTMGTLESVLGNEAKKRFIKSIPIFAESKLLQVEYDHLESVMVEKRYKKGAKLAEAGKPGHQYLWIVKEGKLMVTNSDGKIFFLGSAGYFGDKAVRHKDSKANYVSEDTCVCEEDTICWILKRRDIESVIGNVQRLGKPIPFVPATIDNSVDFKDIDKHRILGMGKSSFSLFRF